MLINEFDLDLEQKDEPRIFNSNFYWLQMRDNVNTGLSLHLVILIKRHYKGIYKIMPNFTIVIE